VPGMSEGQGKDRLLGQGLAIQLDTVFLGVFRGPAGVAGPSLIISSASSGGGTPGRYKALQCYLIHVQPSCITTTNAAGISWEFCKYRVISPWWHGIGWLARHTAKCLGVLGHSVLIKM
jgi:hypothetical protein